MKKSRIVLGLTPAALLLLAGVCFAADPIAVRHGAIHWKMTDAPGITIVDGQIRDWPESLGARPTEEQIAVWVAEYQAYKSTADAAEAARIAAKTQALTDNLPSWAQVETTVSNITNLTEAKVYLLKLSRIVYWLAKDKAE